MKANVVRAAGSKGRSAAESAAGSSAEPAAENSFFREVWDLVAKVPEGKVVSYGQIAGWLGRPRASRMVGWAMHGTPRGLRIPCHRVVSSSGRLVPGWETQRDELEAEGVTFKANGCVDMAKHAWDGRPAGKATRLPSEATMPTAQPAKPAAKAKGKARQ